jgi:6-pyruvoyltetrahydropterin/6-carboxytetrahydropterin synthase
MMLIPGSLIEQQFTRRFCFGHRFTSGTSIKCATSHGHNSYVTWNVINADDRIADYYHKQFFDFNTNMDADFASVKGKIHSWIDDHLDHSMFLRIDDPMFKWISENEPEHKIATFLGDPTTEMIAACMFSKINAFLSIDGVMKCNCLKLEETPTNSIIVRSSFNLPTGSEHWWNRADTSIRDY